MTPKEKAVELRNKMRLFYGTYKDADGEDKNHYHILKSHATQCAIIAVDEVLEFMRMDDEYNEDCHMINTHWVGYWHQVKEELQKPK